MGSTQIFYLKSVCELTDKLQALHVAGKEIVSRKQTLTLLRFFLETEWKISIINRKTQHSITSSFLNHCHRGCLRCLEALRTMSLAALGSSGTILVLWRIRTSFILVGSNPGYLGLVVYWKSGVETSLTEGFTNQCAKANKQTNKQTKEITTIWACFLLEWGRNKNFKNFCWLDFFFCMYKKIQHALQIISIFFYLRCHQNWHCHRIHLHYG